VQATVPGYGQRYRRWVLDSLRYLDVQDLATGGDHVPELGEVYVDVALVSRAAYQASGHPLSQAGEGIPERQSIGELLDRRSPVVLAVTGPPGSGKSTMLADAARRGAHTGLRGRSTPRPFPILLALREHAASIVADPAISLPDVIREAVGGGAGKEPSGWWGRQLRRGRCLVLLDGLDEVARAGERGAVADWVKRQIAAHPGNHFVITSRSYGLPGPLTAQADVFVIRPFTADQVQLFLDRWYLAAERHATGGSGRAAPRAVQMRASESAARLTSLLGQHPALHDLAVNPLLLTMIATAHRYRGALPDSRADLYGEICHVLLSRRSRAKDLPELLSWPAKQALLAMLAYHMMCDHVSNLPVGRVLEILGPQLERFPPSVTGEAFLDDISRNGLFIESPSGGYSFAHLTFQEYLAARHVGANPDLVKSLADSVSDPWWHEAILLYAATADASPIVRACLESGTLPALTLAFDCGEATTELDPELRRRLGFERRRAFDPDCSTEHRRLIAGVMAARLARRTLITGAGARICARPVPADLYWLFLADTQAPRPDNPCDPHAQAGQPATGIWGTEALAFVKWLNSITVTAAGVEVRLPRQDELQEEVITSALSGRLPDSVTSAWTAPLPELWLRPGQPHPHELTGAALHQAIAADIKSTAIVPQILNAAVVNVALNIVRDLDDIRALSGALADDLTVRASSGGQTVELMHAHAHSIVLAYTHALGLARANAITHTCATDQDLIGALDLAGARALAEAIAGQLAGAIGLARTRAVELADAIDLDLSIFSAFDFDIDHALDLARVHASVLDRADLLAHKIVNDPDPGLARAFGLDDARPLDPALPMPAVLGLPLRWVADGPLASTLLQVLTQPSPSGAGDPYLAFALALSSRAGIHETTQLRAALSNSLSSALGDLEAAESDHGDGSPGSNRATALGRLTDACLPMGSTHQSPSPSEAAALRVVATALAGGATVPGSDAPDILRAVAATVTVIENRSKGESKTGESIILALV
jgi:NACHT domain